MQFDREKLKTVILYTCAKCDPSELGAVKLHKVLYFSDMLHYAERGSPITGATYKKRPFGPTCDELLLVLREMQRDEILEIRDTDYFGYVKKVFNAKTKPDISKLSRSEVELVDEVIDFVCRNNTAKTISEFSHNRAWEHAEFGAIIPYHSVFQIFPAQVSPEALEWALGEASELEAQGSFSDTVGGMDFATFRNRVLEARGSRH